MVIRPQRLVRRLHRRHLFLPTATGLLVTLFCARSSRKKWPCCFTMAGGSLRIPVPKREVAESQEAPPKAPKPASPPRDRGMLIKKVVACRSPMSSLGTSVSAKAVC